MIPARSVAPWALVLAGCAPIARAPAGGSAPAGPAATPSSTAAPSATSAAPGAAQPAPLPSLADVAARAPSIAPGLREAARGELAGDRGAMTRPVVSADAGDTCVRVAIVASAPVSAALVATKSNEVLAETRGVTDGALGPRGPVCVRRGDAIALRVEGTAPWTGRFVAWASR